MGEIPHGTLHGYKYHRCRCADCTGAVRRYQQDKHGAVDVDRHALSDLLHEICPDGLTDDCPARRAKIAA